MINTKETTGVMILFAIIIGLFAFIILSSNNHNIEKITYCHIDSISQTSKYEFMPELLTRYHTDCNITISSVKVYKLGDSIQIKTIIIQ